MIAVGIAGTPSPTLVCLFVERRAACHARPFANPPLPASRNCRHRLRPREPAVLTAVPSPETLAFGRSERSGPTLDISGVEFAASPKALI
jgi:hypothetical protein